LSHRLDGKVGELKNKIDSLEDLLRISRHTIQTLQTKLADLEASYLEKLTEQNVQLRQFETELKEQQRNADDSGSLDRQEMIKKLERMQEIAKTEAILEGQVWTPFDGFRVSILFTFNIIYSYIYWI
jgi:hypothetical protein